MKGILRPALTLLLLFCLLTGILYPILVTVAAQGIFHHQANGSILNAGGKNLGADMIGQEFNDGRFFWGRPSATDPVPYHAASSSGSNLGPTNADWLNKVAERIEKQRKAHPDQSGPVPIELVTASASGLDPHISPAAAEYQVQRLAKARGLNPAQVRALIDVHTEGRTFGLLGEPRINVLKINLALEKLGP